MTAAKSPGAMAALGALGGLGERRVVSETSHRQDCAQVSICATIIGDDLCKAEGITARGSAPVLALCRKLVAAGHDPGAPLEAWRGATLCLRVRTIGEGAKLTVRTAGNGRPIFASQDSSKRCKGLARSPKRVGCSQLRAGADGAP